MNFANSSKPLRDSPGDLSLSGSSFPSVPVAKHWTGALRAEIGGIHQLLDFLRTPVQVRGTTSA